MIIPMKYKAEAIRRGYVRRGSDIIRGLDSKDVKADQFNDDTWYWVVGTWAYNKITFV